MLPEDNFPDLETADFNDYNLVVIPAFPNGPPTINEANLGEVQGWLASLGYHSAYVVFSRSMTAFADFYGAPYGYAQLVNAVRSRPGWSVVYRNADTTIYRVRVG